jgi:hypothetical protein
MALFPWGIIVMSPSGSLKIVMSCVDALKGVIDPNELFLPDGNSQLLGNPRAAKLVRMPLHRWSVAALSGAAVHPIYQNDEDCVFIKIAPHNLARNGLELLMVVIVKAISSKTKTYLVFLQRLDFSSIMPNPFQL